MITNDHKIQGGGGPPSISTPPPHSQGLISTLKPQNRQKIIIRIIDKIKIYYSIDFIDYSILSIIIICRLVYKKWNFIPVVLFK